MKKFLYVINIFFSIVILIIISVYAAQYYTIAPGGNAISNEWTPNKKITNNCSSTIFVPTNSQAEWTSVVNHTSPTVANCIVLSDPVGAGCITKTSNPSGPYDFLNCNGINQIVWYSPYTYSDGDYVSDDSSCDSCGNCSSPSFTVHCRNGVFKQEYVSGPIYNCAFLW